MKNKELNEIGIILKPSTFDDLPNLITNLVRWLSKREKTIFFLEAEKERFSKHVSSKILNQINFVTEKYIFAKVDLLLSLGGDGTFLGVCRNVSPRVPVFSVNLGRLGFITEFSKKDFYEELNTVLAGRYSCDKKHLFSLKLMQGKKEIRKEYFFNDAVFSKNDISRMFGLNVETDTEHIYDLSGDGLIISSTSGSTAYSLAAGGPIVHPDVKALLLTPICPHSLTYRPLVLPDTSILKISLLDKKDSAHITLDGQTYITLDKANYASISKEPRKTILVIKNSERTYFHTLKEKFVHGRRD